MNIPEGMEAQWREFVGRVEKRLEQGAKEYGDASLKAPPKALAGEIEEEILDIVGWGFLLWLRMKTVKDWLP